MASKSQKSKILLLFFSFYINIKKNIFYSNFLGSSFPNHSIRALQILAKSTYLTIYSLKYIQSDAI